MNLKKLQTKYSWAVKNISLYFSASLLKTIVSLLMNPFVAMNMSHTDYAITGYFSSFSSLFFPIISLSFMQYYAKNFYLFPDGKREKMRITLISSLLLLGGLELVIILISFYAYMIVSDVSFPFFPYAVLSFATIFFNSFFLFALTDLKMKKDAFSFFKFHFYNTVLFAVLILILVVLSKLGALGYLSASLITGIIAGIYCISKLIKKIEIDKLILKDALLFCWPLIIAASMNYFYSGVDRAMLERLNDNYNLGLYNVAFSITGYLAILSTALSQTFQPDIFQAVSVNNKKKVITIIASINLANAMLIALFIAIAPMLIKILTFDRYTEASDFARILALKNVSSFFYFSMSSIIIAYGYSKVTLINKLLGMIICISAFNLLITRYGFYGAAWGQVLSFLFLSIISFIFLFYKYQKRKKLRSC